MGWMKQVFSHIEEAVANRIADGIVSETCPDSARCANCGKVFPNMERLKEHQKDCGKFTEEDIRKIEKEFLKQR